MHYVFSPTPAISDAFVTVVVVVVVVVVKVNVILQRE